MKKFTWFALVDVGCPPDQTRILKARVGRNLVTVFRKYNTEVAMENPLSVSSSVQ